jgi:hypothetical protein
MRMEMLDISDMPRLSQDRVEEIIRRIGLKVIQKIEKGEYSSKKSLPELEQDILSFYARANKSIIYDTESPLIDELPVSVHHLVESKEVPAPEKGTIDIVSETSVAERVVQVLI